MSRADLMLSVLKDGKRYSRREIQWLVGYFLTNNAASELRKRGLNVVHTREGRVDYYQLSPPLTEPAGAPYPRTPAGSVSGRDDLSDRGLGLPSSSTDGECVGNGLSDSAQLSLEDAA